MSKHYKPSLWVRLVQWYINKFVTYITIQQSNEHFFISKQLWHSIIEDIPIGNRNNIKVLFKKYMKGKNYEYLMIVNPIFEEEFDDSIVDSFKEAAKEQAEFDKSLENKPRSYKIIENVKRMNSNKSKSIMPFTAQIQYNVFGHIGFQGVQPSPAEIVYEYGLDFDVMKKFRKHLELTDRIPLEVIPIEYKPEVYGDRKAYVITSHILHAPTPTFAKSFDERRAEYKNRVSAQRRAAGIAMRNKQIK